MSNKKDWIDFDEVKQSISMEMLIVQLGLYPLQRKGEEVRLKCPFHNGKSDNSMAINLERNSFYCFGCKSRGGVIDFVSRYENCHPRQATAKLVEWFQLETTNNGLAPGSREAVNSSVSAEKIVPSLTPAHLIASIEHQLAELKKLILPS